ncbi:hypothetical protein TREMEDRAFT_25048 [Tremella mesenterica DSM 1558]|uniref:uncharacterized protein n=1 Tax=Tremella mesenterica (strain ATCC 24925 / CBS 8224 / DSM 1558 / NBRC 9311 / NRRL Y-6157 / RJB 2259-6 / UBC 559-6) TaxID=578456 RepID=UPI0003F4915F|nr:uncharacterized protein TREMEDRAFT_25048 [Tremella mesenterica DSM 1558]EIW73228.1 hypothetical protein TREMEDRAFT_25048 [Tremella mesenterica DSM 1558]
MPDLLLAASRYKKKHPSESFASVSLRYNIPKTTLYNRFKGVHSPRGNNVARALSIPQEYRLINKINEYANRGTLLTPRFVKELAEAAVGRSLGQNWTSRFLLRHRDRLSSQYNTYQELSRLRADKPETRKAWYSLVKRVIDSGLYPPHCMFNMDESGFDLSYERRVRRVTPRAHKRNTQAVGPNSEHITSIACIGVDINAPQVPPTIIYQGMGQVLPAWTQVREPDIVQKGMVTQSGWSNTYICQKWLTDVFDPATRDHVPPHCRRLLFLDGADPHVKVEFLELCWSRNIVVIIFPAGLTGELQPLDVDFFNHLKRTFFNQLDDYQRGSCLSRAAKGMFWRWHQVAWKGTMQDNQIKAAWRKAGLWPLDPEVMGAVDLPTSSIPPIPTTPPPQGSSPDLETPRNYQRLRKYSSLIRQGVLDPKQAFEKARKGLEESLADCAFKDREVKDMRAAMTLDKEARGSRKRAIYKDGEVFDPEYQERNVEALAKRKKAEQESRMKKKTAALAGKSKGKQRASPASRRCSAGPSTIA